MRVLHLSDTHLDRADEPNRHGVNATASLRLMLAELRHQRDVGAVVVSGDLADDGAVEAYTTLRELVGEFAAGLGAPLFLSTGNHDERGAFAKVLGSGHLGADGGDCAELVLESAAGERAAVTTVDGWRFVTLDSLVPGEVWGRIGAVQLDWLREVLRTPAARGTVLVLHHPPVALDHPLQRFFGLRDPSALADVVRGTDVRAVLTGHFHIQLCGFLAGVPVWATPGVVNRIDLTARPGTERAVRGASATLVELGGPAGPLFHTLHARDPRAHETVHDLDEERIDAFVAARRPRD
ncbi:metallophosphoesterase [Streptomyces sp. NPDC058867]|uniref:metallophosphoesterase n=1 Tax=unclassified Streptomyces TaxID=2593676 RepID=UPI0036ABB94A